MNMALRRCHVPGGALVLLLLLLADCCPLGRADDDNDYRELCRTDRGRLLIHPAHQFITSLNDGPQTTVFVSAGHALSFKCRSDEPDDLVYVKRVGHRHGPLQPHEAVSRLEPEDLRHRNAVNYYPEKMSCHVGDAGDDKEDFEKCGVTVIVIHQAKNASQCISGHDSLSCEVSPWLEQASPTRGSEFDGRTKIGSRFVENIRYSFHDASAGKWVYCDEFDGNGAKIGVSTHAFESSTQTIRCPFTENVSRQVIIRIERTNNVAVSVGLPVLNKPKPKFTYFNVVVESTVSLDEAMIDKHDRPSNGVFLALGLSFALLVILFLVIVFWNRKLFQRRNPVSKFYAGIQLMGKEEEQRDKKSSSHGKDFHLDVGDNVSLRTETTTAYDRIARDGFYDETVLNLFRPDELDTTVPVDDTHSWQRMDKGLLRTLLQRQLSGDPSKLNPELSLNQQVGVLAYDAKLEIDRSNFSVGSLLGSGHFGAVYVGEAHGLLHPGSRSKVAVKTVNDCLDKDQFTSLLCEMKILSNLDLHPNLVNLVGSCTGQMDQRQLWLLLEYCPHGDMKKFLLNNRNQFRNSISGLVALDLSPRLFLKWAHNVAKGMDYLSSKRIMHGDLAARNVLIGENYMAKVSDFGLSKSMYDNIRYRKQERNDVPWKWMALEYLQDLSFTLRSDAWSYGVVLWEMFSLGQEPYGTQGDREDVVKSIKNGHRLQLPEEVTELDWSAAVYNDVMCPCWHEDPNLRPSFGQVVASLERLLDVEELAEYAEECEENEVKRRLMLEPVTLSKRASAVPVGAEDEDAAGSYHRISIAPQTPRPSRNTAITQPESAGSSYITMKDALDVSNNGVGAPANNDSPYLAIEKAKAMESSPAPAAAAASPATPAAPASAPGSQNLPPELAKNGSALAVVSH